MVRRIQFLLEQVLGVSSGSFADKKPLNVPERIRQKTGWDEVADARVCSEYGVAGNDGHDRRFIAHDGLYLVEITLSFVAVRILRKLRDKLVYLCFSFRREKPDGSVPVCEVPIRMAS